MDDMLHESEVCMKEFLFGYSALHEAITGASVGVNPIKKAEFATAPPNVRAVTWLVHLRSCLLRKTLQLLKITCHGTGLQDIERILQEDTQVLESFTELLTTTQRGQEPAGQGEDPRPEEVPIQASREESTKTRAKLQNH